MQITIAIEDTYANGDEFAPRTETVAVDPPATDDTDFENWADDALFPFTGQGEGYASIDGLHEVQVIDCTERADLVGRSFSFG